MSKYMYIRCTVCDVEEIEMLNIRWLYIESNTSEVVDKIVR